MAITLALYPFPWPTPNSIFVATALGLVFTALGLAWLLISDWRPGPPVDWPVYYEPLDADGDLDSIA